MKYSTIKQMPQYTSGKLYFEIRISDGTTYQKVVEGTETMKESLSSNRGKVLLAWNSDGSENFLRATNDYGYVINFQEDIVQEAIKNRLDEQVTIYAEIYFRERIGYEEYGDAIVLGTSNQVVADIWTNTGLIELSGWGISLKEPEIKTLYSKYEGYTDTTLDAQGIQNHLSLASEMKWAGIDLGATTLEIAEIKPLTDPAGFFAQVSKDLEQTARYFSNICNGKKVMVNYNRPTSDLSLLVVVDSNSCIPSYDEKNSTDTQTEKLTTEVTIGGYTGILIMANVYSNQCAASEFGVPMGKANPTYRKLVRKHHSLLLVHPKDPSKVLYLALRTWADDSYNNTDPLNYEKVLKNYQDVLTIFVF